MLQRNLSTFNLSTTPNAANANEPGIPEATRQAVQHSYLDGPTIINAHQSDDPSLVRTPLCVKLSQAA